MTETEKDYLAIILMGTGSSYARGPDRLECVNRVLKIAKSDWATLFKLDGAPVHVNVFDVTGHVSLVWDTRGVHDSETKEDIPRLEVFETHFPGRKAKARA